MKRLIFKYLSIICCTVAVSCTYEYEAEIPDEADIVVIDGRIVAGSTSTVNISKATRLDGTTSQSRLVVSGVLECEDGTTIQGISSDTPSYYYDPTSSYYNPTSLSPSISFDTKNIDPSKRYKVFIDAGEEGSFESDWLPVFKAPVIDDLSYVITEGTDEKALDFRISAHSETPYFAVSYMEAWEHTSLTSTFLEYYPETNTVDEASWIGHEHPYYRCWQESAKPITVISSAAHTDNKIVDAYLTKIGQTNLKLSVLYRLIATVTTTSKEYYEYWDNLRKISYVDGDLFTPIPSNMEGNIHRKSGKGTVVGYLGASQAAIDTIYVKNKGFYRWPREYTTILNQLMHYQKNYDFPGDLTEYYCPTAEEWPDAYAKGNVPIREASDDKGMITGVYVWGMKQCVDCRYLGGGLNFPADWPDRNNPNL